MRFQWKRLAVFLLAAIFLAVNVKAMAKEAESRRLSILSVQGDEAFVIKGGSREVKASEGMPLGQGSQVRTGMKTGMYLEADNDKVIKLGSSTIVEISKASSKKLKIFLKNGEIFFNVDKPLGAGEEMSFDAAQTSMSIRGTSGVLKFGGNGMELSLIEGHVEWDLGNERVDVDPGQKVSLKKISGETLGRNGMKSAYQLEGTETFDWRDLDAMALEAALEQWERLDLSAIGLDESQRQEAQARQTELRQEQDRQEEEQRSKEEAEAAKGFADVGGGGNGTWGGAAVRLDQEPAGDSDSDSDEVELALPTGTAPPESTEAEPEETEPTTPAETEPTTPAETEPTTPAESEPDPFTPPSDADENVNGNYFRKSDGSYTWYYFGKGEAFNLGTYSGSDWLWNDISLEAEGLTKVSESEVLSPTP